MRYFLNISYNGTNFNGWQSQPNAIGVQSVIEKALSTVLRQTTPITGAGRTDAGVHAREMWAHFDHDIEIDDKKKFLQSVNGLCGPDISINGLTSIHPDAHARFDASKRTYKYFISFSKDPFQYPFCFKSSGPLDIDEMNLGAKILFETSDFTSFAKLHSDSKTNICKVSEAIWRNIRDDNEALDFIGGLKDGIVFTISADRFLRNMVRAIVGTLLEIGCKRLSISEFKEIIDRKDRCSAGVSMPAKGLFLWKVDYPFPLKL